MSDTSAFVGNVPENYDQYMGPVMFEPFAKETARRIETRPGMRILETAAGTGRVTRHLVGRLSDDGEILSTDLNDDMLRIAKSRIDDPRVRFAVADAQALDFESDSFDDVICQFGVMFFPDKPAGYGEAFRVLKPHRQFVYTVWAGLDENPNARLLQGMLTEMFPDDPPPFLNTPFGFSSERDNRNLMADAGFTHIQFDRCTLPIVAESAEYLARGLVTGSPLSAGLHELGVTDLESVVSEVAERFAKEFGDRPFMSEMTAIYVSGEKP